MPSGRAIVIRGNSRQLPLPDESVDLIVTSPPYYSLRSYTDQGAHYAGQIGAEPTPRQYIESLMECTRDWVRVLKPSGSIFVNLGDTYSSIQGVRENHDQNLSGKRKSRGEGKGFAKSGPAAWGVPSKSLIGIPWRYALACIDEGLIVRRDIIWCLSGGARVYARTSRSDGPVMLRDLARAYRPEDVQLWNGRQWTQVLGWNRSPDRDGALELELRTGERIGCTPGHRWPTQRGVIRADEVRIGDVVQTCRLPEPETPSTPRALPLEDIGWLVGLYLAEGSRSEKMLQFSGHIREDARHARLQRIAKMYHGHAAVYQTSENGATCNISGAVLIGIIDQYVARGTSASKRLRKAAWQRQDAFLRAIVEGYLEGDAHYDAKNDRWRLGFTQNDEWAADLRTLAARLGAKISLRRWDHMFNGQKYPGWRGEWRWTRSAHHNVKQDGEVVAIRASRAREFYDIGVADEPHLFALASGVLTHNSKPNGIPESVDDRVRTSHEYIFHIVKERRYFTAVDEIREPHQADSFARFAPGRALPGRRPEHIYNGHPGQTLSLEKGLHPAGRLPGSVWTIPVQPLIGPVCRLVWEGRTLCWFSTWDEGERHMRMLARDSWMWAGTTGRPSLRAEAEHYAAFPMELPRRVIQGWTPNGICTGCGQGRRPVVNRDKIGGWNVLTPHSRQRAAGAEGHGNEKPGAFHHASTDVTVIGYECDCDTTDAPVRPAVVLDPFGGTGCAAMVAASLGRTGISVDYSHSYSRFARWRTTSKTERAKAMKVKKPPPPPDPRQGALFDMEEM